MSIGQEPKGKDDMVRVPPLGPLLISLEEAERLRRAHAEARYRKERKTRIAKARKHLGLALHWIDKLRELERSAKEPGPFGSK